MASTADNPWLGIPATEYEAHMAEIGQAAALRSVFGQVYAETAPRQVLVLGCTTGKDLALIDLRVTTRAVGIDINAAYIEEARSELQRLGKSVELICGDVLDVDLPSSEFDLVHAALLIEYVDAAVLLQRMARWLAPGGVCSVVSQNPAIGVSAVSKTRYESLLALTGCMSLVPPDELASLARQAGLERTAFWDVPLTGGKSFSTSIFKKAEPPCNSQLPARQA